MSLTPDLPNVQKPIIQYTSWLGKMIQSATDKEDPALKHILEASASLNATATAGLASTDSDERRNQFRTARRHALECSALQDSLVLHELLSEEDSESSKAILDQIVTGLTRLREAECAVFPE